MVQTKRLYLRNLRPADAVIMYGYRNDPSCSRYQAYEATGPDDLTAFTRRFGGSVFLSVQEEQHYAIVRKDGNRLAGDLSIFFSEKDRCFTLGITIAPQFQRLGYAYELLQEVIRQLQAHYPRADIVALIKKENEKSIALFQKLGFVEECFAEAFDSYVYTIFGATI